MFHDIILNCGYMELHRRFDDDDNNDADGGDNDDDDVLPRRHVPIKLVAYLHILEFVENRKLWYTAP